MVVCEHTVADTQDALKTLTLVRYSCSKQHQETKFQGSSTRHSGGQAALEQGWLH